MLAALLFLVCSQSPQQVQETRPEAPMAFTGATLHPVSGPRVENGILIVQGGKILDFGGPSTPIPENAVLIDVRGKTIIPGLVDTHSHVGIYPRPAVPAHSDGNEGSGPVQSGLRAVDAIWPDDPGFRMALGGGITTANIMPGSGNVIGGQTLYVKFRGRTIEEMRLQPEGVLGGLKMANGENPKNFNFTSKKLPPSTRMKLAALQRAEFIKAREYQRKWESHRQARAAGKESPEPERDPTLEPLVEVLERKRTVHFHCHRADDLLTAVRLSREFNFEIVLQHATEGYRVAAELAANKIPVSLTLIDSPGGKLETIGLIEENAALLTRAGVKVAINTDDSITESRFYLRTGAIAVRGGLSEDEALRCLTINPAEMMHLDHRLGSLDRGKDADFVILSGPPFSVYTQVLRTYIDGKLVFDREQKIDWTYQAGGFALLDRQRVPATPAMVKPMPTVKAPAIPDGAKKATPESKQIAIFAGRIHTVSGNDILDGVILVEDGKIRAVGPRGQVALPENVHCLSAAVVTPGLIDASSCVGLTGGANVAADQDQDEKSDPNQSDLQALDGFNPDEGLLEIIRREGVTVLHATPGRLNVLAGQTAIFRAKGRSAEGMALRTPAGLLINLGETPKGAHGNKAPTTRMATAALVRSAFAKAQSYARKQSEPGKEKPSADLRLDALTLALQRKIPVIFSAHRADDLLTGMRLAREFNLDARLDLATEAYLISDELAKARIPIILHPTMQRAGSSMETYHSYLGTARVLADVNVSFAIGTNYEGYVPKTRILRHEAAMAAVNGLGQARALAAVTLEPAKILGINNNYGSIEPGKVADLVLFDGDCFEHASHVTHTLIDGRVIFDRADYLALPFSRRALPLTGTGSFGCCLGVW